MARLCDIAGKNMLLPLHIFACTTPTILFMKFLTCLLVDPKVDVIYISPVELNDEVYQYYSKLLGMKARRSESDAKETGDEEEDDIENRYKIIVPEAVDRFPVSQRRYTVYFDTY